MGNLFNFFITDDSYWKNRLLDAAGEVDNEESMQKFLQEKEIKEYQYFYTVYNSLPKFIKQNVNQTWQYTCLTGDAEIFSNECASFPDQNKERTSFLHYAAATGNIEILETALDLAERRELNINQTDENGLNALDYAYLSTNNQRVIDKLINEGLTNNPHLDDFIQQKNNEDQEVEAYKQQLGR